MRILNLVEVTGKGKSAHITLTSFGKELALAGKNPLIDIGLCDSLSGDNIPTALSRKERETIIRCLTQHCEKETSRMQSVLSFIESRAKSRLDGVSRNEILDAVRSDKIRHFSSGDNYHTSNTELSGVLGRMWDLGLVKNYTDLTRPTRIKRYVCDKEERKLDYCRKYRTMRFIQDLTIIRP